MKVSNRHSYRTCVWLFNFVILVEDGEGVGVFLNMLLYWSSGNIKCNLDKTNQFLSVFNFSFLETLEDNCKPIFKQFFSNDKLYSNRLIYIFTQIHCI